MNKSFDYCIASKDCNVALPFSTLDQLSNNIYLPMVFDLHVEKVFDIVELIDIINKIKEDISKISNNRLLCAACELLYHICLIREKLDDDSLLIVNYN